MILIGPAKPGIQISQSTNNNVELSYTESSKKLKEQISSFSSYEKGRLHNSFPMYCLQSDYKHYCIYAMIYFQFLNAGSASNSETKHTCVTSTQSAGHLVFKMHCDCHSLYITINIIISTHIN